MKHPDKLLALLIILFFVFMNVEVSAQKSNASISGKIVSADSIAVENVTVQLKNAHRSTITNENGNFSFYHLPALNDTLIVSSIALNFFNQPVVLKSNQQLDLGTIHLDYNTQQLEDISVQTGSSKSYKIENSSFATKTTLPVKETPQTISVITQQLIKDKMSWNVKDIIKDVAGVNDYSGFDEYTIRGFKAENARNINGLRGYSSTFTNSMLVNIERIEVIKGPSATLYGNCDPGGTVNLVTKKPLLNQQQNISAGYGSWDHYRVQGDVTGPINKSKTLLYRFNAGYDTHNSFVKEFYAKAYQIAPSLSFQPNQKISLNIDFSFSHTNSIVDRGQPGIEHNNDLLSTPINLSLTRPGDYLHENDFATDVLFQYKINPHITFNSGYLNYITKQNVAEHAFKNYITADSVNLYYTQWQYHTVTNTLSNYFNFSFNTGAFKHNVVAGYDYISTDVELNQQSFENTTFGEGNGIAATFSLLHPQYLQPSIKKYKPAESDAVDLEEEGYHTQGLYVQEQMSYKKWSLLMGIRSEFYADADDEDASTDTSTDLDEHILLPRFGLVFNASKIFSVYATYNKGFDPFEMSTTRQIFNAPFKPIVSELYETGVKANFFQNKMFATISLYSLAVENVAVNANDPNQPDLYVQRGRQRSNGIETELNGNITEALSIHFSYAYNKAKIVKSNITEDVGKIIEDAPLHSSTSWIKYNFQNNFLKGFAVYAGHTQQSKRNTLVDGFTLPGFIIFNAGLQYNYKAFTIAANIENLTNKKYWLSAYNNISKWPGEPRNFMMTVDYNF